jgi:lysophospholipase L1-like esterase
MKSFLLSIGMFLLLSCFVCSNWSSADESKRLPLSLQPEVQTAEWAKAWWMPRHESKLKEKESLAKIDLVFVGDSITHAWEQAGKSTWDEYYAKRNAFNLGFSGDRTEQVLWRLDHGALDGTSPKVAVIMIGTNNTGHRQDPAADTAAGIQKIIESIHKISPSTKILLLGVFPRGAEASDTGRKRNVEINEILAKFPDALNHVTYLDIGKEFLDSDGKLPASIMPDALHPNEDGYRIWAKAMEPTLSKLLSGE